MNIKKLLRDSWIGENLSKLLDFYYHPSLFKSFTNKMSNRRCAVLIGTPCHHNVGDHLLAYNELKFIDSLNKYDYIIEIPTRIYQHNSKFFEKNINKNVDVFITGGGWMGDVWPEDEKIIEDIITSFSKNKIFIFPQTLFYSNEEKNYATIEITKQVFKSAKRLCLFLREKDSYDKAKELFGDTGISIFLCPDMGLYSEIFENKNKKNQVGICLRDDREKISSTDIKELVCNCLYNYDMNTCFMSTIFKSTIPVWERNKIILSYIKEFGEKELVITDRLHGMIFSVISGTKCIALDNKTHKVRGVYNQWLKNNDNVLLSDENNICNDIQVMIKKEYSNHSNHDTEQGFENMYEIILNKD